MYNFCQILCKCRERINATADICSSNSPFLHPSLHLSLNAYAYLISQTATHTPQFFFFLSLSTSSFFPTVSIYNPFSLPLSIPSPLSVYLSSPRSHHLALYVITPFHSSLILSPSLSLANSPSPFLPANSSHSFCLPLVLSLFLTLSACLYYSLSRSLSLFLSPCQSSLILNPLFLPLSLTPSVSPLSPSLFLLYTP